LALRVICHSGITFRLLSVSWQDRLQETDTRGKSAQVLYDWAQLNRWFKRCFKACRTMIVFCDPDDHTATGRRASVEGVGLSGSTPIR
jgi:hypothetical protein